MRGSEEHKAQPYLSIGGLLSGAGCAEFETAAPTVAGRLPRCALPCHSRTLERSELLIVTYEMRRLWPQAEQEIVAGIRWTLTAIGLREQSRVRRLLKTDLSHSRRFAERRLERLKQTFRGADVQGARGRNADSLAIVIRGCTTDRR